MFVLVELIPIIYAVIVFSILILAMALLLIAARKRLIPQGLVDIVINGDKENPIKVQPGPSLLTALSEHQIFLPSACGGGGTCAMCTCKVYSGGGDILPTELTTSTERMRSKK